MLNKEKDPHIKGIEKGLLRIADVNLNKLSVDDLKEIEKSILKLAEKSEKATQ